MKLDDRFRALDRTPAPEYFRDAMDRTSRPSASIPTHDGSHRLVAAVVAVVVAAAGIGLAFVAFRPESASDGGLPSPMASNGEGLAHLTGYATWMCGAAVTGCPPGGVPASLFRPLQLPSLAPNGSCPTAPAHRVGSYYGPALGDGPVYAIIPGGGPLRFQYPPDARSDFAGTDWGGNKVVWAIAPTYPGPVLVRGMELGGPHQVGFSAGSPTAFDALQFPPGHGWRDVATATRLQAPGCYAYQVDGTSFSEVIVFRAMATGPSMTG